MIPALFLASTAVSAIGQMSAARGARKTADFNAANTEFGGKLNAFNIKTEREIAMAEAQQRATDRVDAYNRNLSVNLANFAAAGRSIQNDRSVKAFLNYQKELAAEDTTRISTMAQLEGNKLMADAIAMQAEGNVRAANMRAAGRAQQQSAMVGAFTTMVGGIFRYNQIRY